MDIQEQTIRLNNIIAKNQHFENLLANEDFMKWRDESVIPHIESMKDAVMGVDIKREGWREEVAGTIIAYQEVQKIYQNLFTLQAKASEMARKQLVELSKAPGQPS